MAQKPHYSELHYWNMEHKVLHALAMAGGRLSKAQITVGPFRHEKPEERDVIMQRLQQQGFIRSCDWKPPRGRTAVGYCLTEKGKRAIG